MRIFQIISFHEKRIVCGELYLQKYLLMGWWNKLMNEIPALLLLLELHFYFFVDLSQYAIIFCLFFAYVLSLSLTRL